MLILFLIILPLIFFIVIKSFDYLSSVYYISFASICFWFIIIFEDKENQLLELKHFMLFPVSVVDSIIKIIIYFLFTRKYYILLIINILSFIIFRVSVFFIASFLLQTAYTLLTAFFIREICIKNNLRNHIGIIPALSLLIIVLLTRFGNIKYMVADPFTSLFCIPLFLQKSGYYFESIILYLGLSLLFPLILLIIKMTLRYGYNASNK
jgi:hypothetical protein